MMKTPTVKIDPEFRALIPPLTSEELQQLTDNVLRDGCRDPLVVWNGRILDGHHRYVICQANRRTFRTVEQRCASRDQAKEWIIRNQFGRRNLTPYVRSELALKLEPLIAAKAKDRQRVHGHTAPGRTLVKKSAQVPDDRKTRTEVAKAAGVSHDTLAKVKVIASEATEAVKERLRRGETTINKEHKALVQATRKAEQVAKIEAVGSLPDGPFHVIVADPPWAYEKRAHDSTHRGASPYPSMSEADISAMPVGSRAADDCVLWLWTTNAFMEQAHRVARAWGFEVKTILTWVKDRMGTGDWLRGQTEHCLLAVRGRPVVTLTNQTTVLSAPLREHSRKPDAFYALVETLCVGTRCELFSREARDGWAAFGAEVDTFKGTV